MMIQVRWQSSDLSILETHPLSPDVTPSKAEDTRTTNAPGLANTDDDQLSEDDYSGGAIAAIIGRVVAVLAMALAARLFVKYHRRGLEPRRQNVADRDHGQPPSPTVGKTALPRGADGPPGPPAALVNELPDHMAAQAYTPDLYPSEMPGEGVRR